VITIQPVNDAPSALVSPMRLNRIDASIAAPGVLANDSDIEGSALTAQLASPPPQHARPERGRFVQLHTVGRLYGG
jgi:hypothetical protein